MANHYLPPDPHGKDGSVNVRVSAEFWEWCKSVSGDWYSTTGKHYDAPDVLRWVLANGCELIRKQGHHMAGPMLDAGWFTERRQYDALLDLETDILIPKCAKDKG